jgi:hypothetical protein
LATKEDLRVKHPDIMWFGLDENFDAENVNYLSLIALPFKFFILLFICFLCFLIFEACCNNKTKLFQHIFTPINESWTFNVGECFSRIESRKESTTVSEVVDGSAEVDTDDSHKVEMKGIKIENCSTD